MSKLGNRDVTLADIHNMPILLNTVREILRAYPAGGGINIRSAYRSNIMAGYDIPKETLVVTSTYLTQNDPRYWQHPEQFNPDRWNDPRVPIPGSWTVFGDGARGCAGREFALLAGAIKFVLLQCIHVGRSNGCIVAEQILSLFTLTRFGHACTRCAQF